MHTTTHSHHKTHHTTQYITGFTLFLAFVIWSHHITSHHITSHITSHHIAITSLYMIYIIMLTPSPYCRRVEELLKLLNKKVTRYECP